MFMVKVVLLCVFWSSDCLILMLRVVLQNTKQLLLQNTTVQSLPQTIIKILHYKINNSLMSQWIADQNELEHHPSTKSLPFMEDPIQYLFITQHALVWDTWFTLFNKSTASFTSCILIYYSLICNKISTHYSSGCKNVRNIGL